MTHEEQENYTIKKKEGLLAEYFERRKKQLAAERSKAIKKKPPTRTQVRNMMITYLKHMGKYTRQKLKHKTFEELQKLYQKEQNWIDDFVPMDSKKEEKKSVEPGSKGKKGKRIKRVVDSALKQKSFKKQKMMQEQESAKSDEEESADYEQDEIWSNQQDWNLMSWKLYEYRGVHTLLIVGTLNCFNLLVEKRYPLNKEMLEKMLNWKLKAKAESIMSFKLLKFIKLQVQEWRDVWIHPPGDQDADNEET
nr:hypothetical protein [Tanacetum cinerariifolium]